MNAAALDELGEHIQASLPEAVSGLSVRFEELTITVRAGQIIAVLNFLRKDASCRFRQLIDITAVDFPQRQPRFDVVYHLLSMHHNQRVRLAAPLAEDAAMPSAISVFPNANWYEREVFDMFGIPFADHPDLRRILTDYGFSGHPLRKDFPLTGFVQVRYDDERKRVVNEPVLLTQEFRSFDFTSPWEGAEYVLPGDEKALRPATPEATKADGKT